MTFETLVRRLLSDHTIPIHYDYYTSEYFSDIQNIGGIYSWHISPNVHLGSDNEKADTLNALLSFFSPNEIMLDGYTPFHNYKGLLEENVLDSINVQEKINRISSLTKENYLNVISTLLFFQSPLYIGISKTLKKRINKHSSILSQIYNEQKFVDDNEPENTEFGKRILEFIRSSEENQKIFYKFSPSNFFVKVIYINQFSKSELENIEYVLNRSIKPKFGKR